MQNQINRIFIFLLSLSFTGSVFADSMFANKDLYTNFKSNLQVFNVLWWNSNYAVLTPALSIGSNDGFIGVTNRPESIEALSYIALTKDEKGNFQPAIATNWSLMTKNMTVDLKESITSLKLKNSSLIKDNNNKKVILTDLRKQISLNIPIDNIVEIREKTRSIGQEILKLEEESKVIKLSLSELDRIKFDKSEIAAQEILLQQANQKLRTIKNAK